MRRATIVLGLGNPLMADEGIGVHLLERLVRRAEHYPEVDFVDAGTGGMSILHLIEGRTRAIFIDCAFMGQEPGAIKRFTPEEVHTTKVLAHQSLHEADLLRLLSLAKELGQCPERVIIFGIEPQVVEPRQGISPALLDKTEHYLSEILSELQA